MKNQKLLTNMYREQRKFSYFGKIYQRGVHVSINEYNPRYVIGFITKWGEINASFIYDALKDVTFAYSFRKKKMIKQDKSTKALFKTIRKVINNYMIIREAEELKIAV